MRESLRLGALFYGYTHAHVLHVDAMAKKKIKYLLPDGRKIGILKNYVLNPKHNWHPRLVCETFFGDKLTFSQLSFAKQESPEILSCFFENLEGKLTEIPKGWKKRPTKKQRQQMSAAEWSHELRKGTGPAMLKSINHLANYYSEEADYTDPKVRAEVPKFMSSMASLGLGAKASESKIEIEDKTKLSNSELERKEKQLAHELRELEDKKMEALGHQHTIISEAREVGFEMVEEQKREAKQIELAKEEPDGESGD